MKKNIIFLTLTALSFCGIVTPNGAVLSALFGAGTGALHAYVMNFTAHVPATEHGAAYQALLCSTLTFPLFSSFATYKASKKAYNTNHAGKNFYITLAVHMATLIPCSLFNVYKK